MQHKGLFIASGVARSVLMSMPRLIGPKTNSTVLQLLAFLSPIGASLLGLYGTVRRDLDMHAEIDRLKTEVDALHALAHPTTSVSADTQTDATTA
jgi:hypothetical protein